MGSKLWLVVVISIAVSDCALAQTNSWTPAGDGYWQDETNWSLAVAPGETLSVLITNDSSKTVLLDATTSAATFSNTMTVNDLTVAGAGVATNALFLSNTGLNVPLRVHSS